MGPLRRPRPSANTSQAGRADSRTRRLPATSATPAATPADCSEWAKLPSRYAPQGRRPEARTAWPAWPAWLAEPPADPQRAAKLRDHARQAFRPNARSYCRGGAVSNPAGATRRHLLCDSRDARYRAIAPRQPVRPRRPSLASLRDRSGPSTEQLRSVGKCFHLRCFERDLGIRSGSAGRGVAGSGWSGTCQVTRDGPDPSCRNRTRSCSKPENENNVSGSSPRESTYGWHNPRTTR